jgi:hypothetical protein
MLSSQKGTVHAPHFKPRGFFMNLHVYLLVFFLLFSLTLLCVLCWLYPDPAPSGAAAKLRTKLGRLRHRRAPQAIAPSVASPALSRRVQGQRQRKSRPWREVKSRRGAPKRIPTDGFACPHPQCSSFGISDVRVHASFGRWQAWPGRAHPDVSRSCLP